MMARESSRPSARRPQVVRRSILIGAMIMLLVMTVLGPMLTYSELPLAGDGNPLRQGIYALLLVSIVYAVRPLSDPARLNAVPVPILVALAWCWISVTWAIDPGVSVRRVTLTTIIIFSTFIAVKQIGFTTTLGLLRIVLAITLLINFVTVLLFPEYGIHQSNMPGDKDLLGDWRGIMLHKNFAGAVSALVIPMLFFDAKHIKWWIRAFTIAGALVFLYFSQSKTSIGLVGFGVIAGLAFQYYSPRYRGLAVAGLLLLAVVVVLFLDAYRNPLRALMRDPTSFTGRTEIWRALLNYSDAHLWLGSGYGSFWNIGPASPIYSYAKGWVTELTSGHNGFLDLTVQLGLPGLVLVLGATMIWPLAKLIASDKLPGQRAAIVIALIFFCISHNATESTLFDRDTIVQVFLMSAIALIAPLEGEARRGRERAKQSLSFAGMRSSLT